MYDAWENEKCWLEKLKEIQGEPETHDGLILGYVKSKVYRTHPAHTDDCNCKFRHVLKRTLKKCYNVL